MTAHDWDRIRDVVERIPTPDGCLPSVDAVCRCGRLLTLHDWTTKQMKAAWDSRMPGVVACDGFVLAAARFARLPIHVDVPISEEEDAGPHRYRYGAVSPFPGEGT